MGKIDRSLKLSNRERMIRACLNQDVDRPPYWSAFGPWGETYERWKKEGLEGDDWRAPFGLDAGFAILPVNLGYIPEFEYKLLSEDENTRTVRDRQGITSVQMKGHATIPKYIDYPVKTRDDWEAIKKERLDPEEDGRFPKNWDDIIKWFKSNDVAVQAGGYPSGLFGCARDFMGVENLLLAFYDDPGLIRDMMDYMTDLWLNVYAKILRDIQIDHIHIWEDMSGKQGPLISPAMFREFMTPNYLRITRFANENGIPVVSVDTDGNMDVLMPLLEESGINMVLPFEVQAGCDVVRYRRQYPGVAIHGGIDKRAVALGKKEIDAELARVGELFDESGYIAGLDHLPHPEISFQNFSYYMNRVKELTFKDK
ncbi:MAG: hypothetical protein FWF03_03330 [Defluviitaleaceae bacterium]|nr:hypothetical protein [Defluviitaleaceae bacterium]